MNIEAYEKAVEIVGKEGRGHFAGPIDDQLISKAETLLGIEFPTDYIRFLKDYGAGSFGASEFYGITSEELESPGVPNGIWYTLNERNRSGLPSEFVVIASSGSDEIYCLKTNEEGVPVVLYVPGVPLSNQTYEKMADSFGDYFLEGIQEEV